MTKLTLAELKKRNEGKAAAAPEPETAKIIVGMGTCGIAAGAQDAIDVLTEELNRAGLPDVEIRRTGCMGLCHSEPTVEVAVPGMPTVVYGKVDAETAHKIVTQHIVRKLLVNGHIYDKPAADIIRT